MSRPSPRIAGAPITWGVCEVPGWGYQLGRDRVLAELASLGLGAVELGPQGFLPNDPDAVAGVLAEYRLQLAGGFVPAVLHVPARRAAALAAVETAASTLAAAGADAIILAAELGDGGYDRSVELGEEAWAHLLDGLCAAEEIGMRHGLTVAFHPHYGTAVESAAQVYRVLKQSRISLCLDTGHLAVGGANPVEITRAAHGRIAHVHLKDVNADLAARVRRAEIGYRDAVARGLYRPLGEGDVDLEGILGLLRVAGYTGWYVLEQDIVLDAEPADGQGPLVAARSSVDYLKRVLAA